MTLLDTLIAQGKRAYRAPREAAADIMALGIPREVVAPAFMVVVILTVLVDQLAARMLPFPGGPSGPFATTITQCLFFLGFTFAIVKVGQAFEGTGTFFDGLLLFIFLQAIMIPLQVALILISAVLPSFQLFLVVAFGFGFYALWLNVNFIAALHGFSGGKALGVGLLAILACAMFFLIFLSLFAPTLVP